MKLEHFAQSFDQEISTLEKKLKPSFKHSQYNSDCIISERRLTKIFQLRTKKKKGKTEIGYHK